LTSPSELFTGHEQQVFYTLIEVRQTNTEEKERLPLNLCLVIDRSTSMQGPRLGRVKTAVSQIINELEDNDTLSIVSFSDRAEVIQPSQHGINRTRAKAKLASIHASGGTEILQGMSLGLSELRKRHSDRTNSHLILLTDGRTYGDDEACVTLAKKAGEQHIGITAMGIGEDWNDILLDEMARQSGGTSAYVSSPNQVQTTLQQCIHSLNTVFAKGMKLGFQCAENVTLDKAFKVLPFLEQLQVNEGAIGIGNLQSDAPLVIVLELSTGARPPGEYWLASLELSADIPSVNTKGIVLKHDLLLHFTAILAESVAVPPAIVNAFRKVTLYEMQQNAWDAVERGDKDKANHQLELVATRLFDLGESQLAQVAMLEAGRIASGALPSSRGLKQLKYGTRSLATRYWSESND
jgi:Ca-activated chloride channel family protein